MVHQANARAKWRLEELRVGGGDAVPLERMQVGREVPRRIQLGDGAEAVGLGMEDLRAQLELPEHIESATLVVVVETDELHERGVALLRGRHHVLDQPLPVPDLDDVPGSGSVPRDLMRAEDGLRRRALDGTVGLHEAGGEQRTRATGVVETVRATRGLQLVAAEDAEEIAEAHLRRVDEDAHLFLARCGGRHGDRERSRQLQEASLGEGQQDRARGGDGGHGATWQGRPDGSGDPRHLVLVSIRDT